MSGSSRPPAAPWLEKAPPTERVPDTGVVRVVDDEQTEITEKLQASPRTSTRDRRILTVVVGHDAGRVIEVSSARTTIGRGSDADVLISDGTISRVHLCLLRWMGGVLIVEDLDSSNGTFINGERIKRAPLRSGDRLQVGANVVLRFDLVDHDEASLQKHLYAGAKIDPLTQLHNRAHLDEQLDREVAFAQRHGAALSVVIVDIDHFKQFNDRHGHLVGDAVLERVARTLEQSCRTEDLVCRWGGEEFLVLLRSTDHDQAVVVAERIREAISSGGVELPDGRRLELTVSIGVASRGEVNGETGDLRSELVALADKRLYRAKRDGRNRVCASDD